MKISTSDLMQWRLLHTPRGEHQSGRVRYAAAMHLYNGGLIDEALLEGFRICAKRDNEYPDTFKPQQERFA